MDFIMFVCTDSEPDTGKEEPGEIDAWVEEGERRGIHLQGEPLQGKSKAKTVRMRNGKLLLTDGPFADTKDWIAGFDLLKCKDIDEAVEFASRHPMARFGRIEVRPIMVWEG